MLRMYPGVTDEPYSHCSSHLVTVQIHACVTHYKPNFMTFEKKCA